MSWLISLILVLLLLSMFLIAQSSSHDNNCHCEDCCKRHGHRHHSHPKEDGNWRGGEDGPSKVELYGKDQYIKLDDGFIRQLVRIDLTQVDIVTNGSDYVKIWVLDDPSNVASTHNSLYNWYDMPDSYLPSSGFMPFIFVQGNDRVKMDINYPVKQILVEARLTRSIS